MLNAVKCARLIPLFERRIAFWLANCYVYIIYIINQINQLI